MLGTYTVTVTVQLSVLVMTFRDGTTDWKALDSDQTSSDGMIMPVNDASHQECAPWYYYNPGPINPGCKRYTDGQYNSRLLKDKVRYTCEAAQLRISYCSTHEEGKGIFLSRCHYFQLDGHNVSDAEAGYIKLPEKTSELNDYMCRSMNRKGHLCSECLEGFGPSFTSTGYACSNCTNTRYGIFLYVVVEFLPVTVFYLTILIFRMNLTSSPMTCFVFYSQMIMSTASITRNSQAIQLSIQSRHAEQLLHSLYSMWNSDFIRYIVPPFCISNKLSHTHIVLLDFISVLYPVCLTIVTWICVELHDHNFRPLVFLWRPLHRWYVRLQRGWDTKRDIIDVFSAFLILSHSKLIFQSVALMYCRMVVKAESKSYRLHVEYTSGLDSRIDCGSPKHLLFAIPASLSLIIALLPVLLLVLYPFKPFRVFLTKCRLDLIGISIFVDKFHCCYRDGTDGGRDMRSFSGLYFLMRYLVCLSLVSHNLPIFSSLSIATFLYVASAVFIALIKPYKKTYMNVLDTVLLLFLALLIQLLSSSNTLVEDIVVFAISLIPGLILWIYVTFKIILKLWKAKCFRKCVRVPRCENNFENANDKRGSEQRPLLAGPTSLTIVDVSSYGSTATHASDIEY